MEDVVFGVDLRPREAARVSGGRRQPRPWCAAELFRELGPEFRAEGEGTLTGGCDRTSGPAATFGRCPPRGRRRPARWRRRRRAILAGLFVIVGGRRPAATVHVAAEATHGEAAGLALFVLLPAPCELGVLGVPAAYLGQRVEARHHTGGHIEGGVAQRGQLGQQVDQSGVLTGQVTPK